MHELLTRMRRVLDEVFAFVGVLRADGTLVELNRGPLRAAGAAWDDVRDQPFDAFPWWNGDAATQAAVREAIDFGARGESTRRDVRVRFADGSDGWLDLQVAPVRGSPDGAIEHLVWSAVDITERRAVEDRLRDAEDRSRLARRASGIGVWDHDPRSGAIYWDERIRELWGLAPGEPVDFERFLASIHPDDREGVRSRSERAVCPDGEREYRDEFRLLVAGRVRWILALGEVTRDPAGTPIRFVGTVQDVTGSRLAERALRESEDRWRLARRASSIGIWDYDPRDGSLHWDPHVRELWGVGPDEPVDFERFLAGVHPDDRERVRELVRVALTPGSSGEYRVEFRRVLGDDVRWMAAIGDVTFVDGVATRLIGTVQDVTEQKRAEQRLREKTDLLEAQDRRKDLFMATLGHEIRNPLAALDSGIRLVLAGVAPPEEILPMMAEHVQQLARLVNDLLEVSRITRGKVALRKESIDLVSLLRSAVEAIRGSVDAKAQTLHIDAPSHLPVEADPTRVEQMFANVLANASKYTPQGGRIDVRCGVDGEDAIVAVTDTGCGLEPGEIETIFEPFVQADPGVGGLGIGLALVRALARLHDGEVTASSAGHRQGSTFTLRLPRGEVHVEPTLRDDGTPSPRRLDGLRVLVVDDLQDSADLLAMLLRTQGADARCAYDGNGALQLAAGFAPQVTLLDLGLPDISGYEVGRALRAGDHGNGMLLLAVTGFGDPGAARRAVDAGFDGRLVKPVDQRQLNEHLSRFLAAGAGRDARRIPGS